MAKTVTVEVHKARTLSLLVLLSSLTFAGCSIAEVTLRHSTTGATVHCGPFSYVGATQGVAVASMNRCLDDYQRQGYVRVAQ